MLTAEQRNAALIEAMTTDGTLTDDALAAAFRAVPRHVFIPESGTLTTHGTALDATANPDRWLAAVYADSAIITQVDDGARESVRGVATSSSSAPTVVAQTLEAAELEKGHRVLEIGTGTGWNAALLSHRLGAEAVTSVEIDPSVLACAREALRRAGYSPATHLADGGEGYRPGAPYDRIIATCGVTRVPRAWIEQLGPGGLVVCPWGPMEGAGVLTRLARADGGSVSGPFLRGVGFMRLRSQRPSAGPPRDIGQEPDEYRLSQTDPTGPLLEFESAFPLSVMVPDWRMGRRWIGSGSGVWISETSGSSWARIYPHGTKWMIEQGGARSLWDEIEEAGERWHAMGRPRPDRFGLTVTPAGRHLVWLDTPDGPSWEVPV